MHFFFTVDVECYGGDYGLEVRGRGLGLDYLLETLGEYRVRATFFVEALGASRWGKGPLREICRLIREKGHEIQLHLHPKVARIEGFHPADDRMSSADRGTQERLLHLGMEILADCGVRKIDAFRAGDLAADENTMGAMAACGLFLSSNRDLDTRHVHPRVNRLFAVANDIDRARGIVDLPISAFRSPFPFVDGKYRHLEICALSGNEMTAALERMVAGGYRTATLLTHPGEFFRSASGGLVPVQKNRRRLQQLLAFLAGCPEIQPATVTAMPTITLPETAPPDLWLQALPAARRMLEQAAARLR